MGLDPSTETRAQKIHIPFFNQVDFKNCFAPYAKLLRLKKASQKLGIGIGHIWIEISIKNAPTLNLYDPMQVIFFRFRQSHFGARIQLVLFQGQFVKRVV